VSLLHDVHAHTVDRFNVSVRLLTTILSVSLLCDVLLALNRVCSTRLAAFGRILSPCAVYRRLEDNAVLRLYGAYLGGFFTAAHERDDNGRTVL